LGKQQLAFKQTVTCTQQATQQELLSLYDNAGERGAPCSSACILAGGRAIAFCASTSKFLVPWTSCSIVRLRLWRICRGHSQALRSSPATLPPSRIAWPAGAPLVALALKQQTFRRAWSHNPLVIGFGERDLSPVLATCLIRPYLVRSRPAPHSCRPHYVARWVGSPSEGAKDGADETSRVGGPRVAATSPYVSNRPSPNPPCALSTQ
jgi:hypothetical protein